MLRPGSSGPEGRRKQGLGAMLGREPSTTKAPDSRKLAVGSQYQSVRLVLDESVSECLSILHAVR